MAIFQSLGREAFGHPGPFRNTTEKVDWILDRLNAPQPVDAMETDWTGTAPPSDLPSFHDSYTASQTPPLSLPYTTPRHSWQVAENILAQLQREPGGDSGRLPQSELFFPATTRRAGPPPRLSARQELDLLNHNLLARQLRTLNPQHPYFSTVRPEGWVPTGRDSMELASIVQSEMRNAGRTEGFPRLERHHHLPRQFWEILPNDIDPESDEYISWLLRELHRLKPQGMHTGDQNWNKRWAEFLLEKHERDKPRIDEKLDRMIIDFLKKIRGDGADGTKE